MSDRIDAVIREAIAPLRESAGDSDGADTGGDDFDSSGADDSSSSELASSPTPASDDSSQAGDTSSETPSAAPADDDLTGIPSHIDQDGVRRENRLPYSRVQAIVQNAQKKARAAFEREHSQHVSTLETRLRETDAVGEIMDSDPERFLDMLATAKPEYARLLGRDGHASAPRQPNQHEAKQRHVRSQIQTAMSNNNGEWDGFADNIDAIIGELRADTEQAARTGKAPTLTLDAAYRRVVVRKLRTPKPAAKKATTPPPTTLVDDADSDPIETAIKRAIAHLKR